MTTSVSKKSNDCLELHRFSIWIRRICSIPFRRYFTVEGLICYPLDNYTLQKIPELKEYVSPWHIIFEDLMLIPSSSRTVEELKRIFGPYFKEKQWKGELFFTNMSFIVALRK